MYPAKSFLSLVFTASLLTGSAFAQSTSVSTDEQKAARTEIEQLSKRIQELSKKLGPDDPLQITLIETKHDRETGRVERRVTTTASGNDTPAWTENSRGMKRLEMRQGGSRIGLGVVMAANTGAGVKVAAVSPTGPAKDAGLQAGDVITAINGSPITGKEQAGLKQARAALANLKEGQTVTVAYHRDGKVTNATLKAGKIEPQMIINREIRDVTPGNRAPHSLAFATRWNGLNMAELNPQLGRYFGTSSGVLVLSQKAEFPQLQAGDVITQIDGRAVSTAREVLRAMHGKPQGAQITLSILRDHKPVSVIILAPKQTPMPADPPRVAMLFNGTDMPEDLDFEIIESDNGEPR